MKEDWDYKEIGEVCDVTDYVANGSFASLRENVQYKSEPDYAILVRLADYTNNFDSSKFVYINEHAYNFLAKSKLHGGEIIMSNVGSLGKEFICPKLDRPMSLAPNSIVIRTPFNKFFYYCFSSTSLQEKIKSISSQTALPKFNKTQFKKLVIPIPSPSEQQHIVEELDLLSSIIEKKKTQLAELNNLAQSLFYEMFGDPIINKHNYQVTKLGDICSTITKGTTPTSVGYSFTEDGVNFIKVESFDKDETYIPTKVAHISVECNEALKRSILEENDILMCIAGTCGRLAIVPKEALPANTNQAFGIIRLKEKDRELLSYVYSYLHSQYIMNLVKELMKGVAQPNLTLAHLRNFNIIMPPASLLKLFSSKIDSINHQKEFIKQSINEVETLFNSRMDYYFN